MGKQFHPLYPAYPILLYKAVILMNWNKLENNEIIFQVSCCSGYVCFISEDILFSQLQSLIWTCNHRTITSSLNWDVKLNWKICGKYSFFRWKYRTGYILPKWHVMTIHPKIMLNYYKENTNEINITILQPSWWVGSQNYYILKFFPPFLKFKQMHV
jgi:hypothetical protein